jgi:hypothetical protein
MDFFGYRQAGQKRLVQLGRVSREDLRSRNPEKIQEYYGEDPVRNKEQQGKHKWHNQGKKRMNAQSQFFIQQVFHMMFPRSAKKIMISSMLGLPVLMPSPA